MPTNNSIDTPIPFAATKGGTAQSTYTKGDILYASAANTLSKLGVGSTGEVLTVAAGVPSWGSASGIPNGVQIYYVAKNGNDTNNGLSIASPFLTFGAATTAASAATPSSTNAFAIVCSDAGIYNENITGVPWVSYYAPSANITGVISLDHDSSAFFNSIVSNSASSCVTYNPSGPYATNKCSYLNVNYIAQNDTTSTSNVINITPAFFMQINININYLFGNSDFADTAININSSSDYLYLTGYIGFSSGAYSYLVSNSNSNGSVSLITNAGNNYCSGSNVYLSSPSLNPEPTAASATSAFGTSITAGTPVQNTAGYTLLVNVCVVVTAATTASIQYSVYPINGSASYVTVVPSFSGAGTFTFSVIIPVSGYLVVSTTGTITVGSITSSACWAN